MAKIYGSNKITGTVGGLRHYKLPDVEGIVVSTSRGPIGDAIKTNAAYARTREHMSEMTPRSKLASQIKGKLGNWSIPIVNRYLIGEINAALRIAQKRNGVEHQGKRSIYLSACKDVLDNIKYYSYKPFADIMKCKYVYETSMDRRMLTVKLSNLIPNEQIKAPAEATHFQYCITVGALSDWVYLKDYEYFAPVYSLIQMQGSKSELEGAWIPVNAKSMGDLTLSVKLRDGFILKDDMTVIYTFGIVYGKMTSEVEELKKDRGSIVFLGAL